MTTRHLELLAGSLAGLLGIIPPLVFLSNDSTLRDSTRTLSVFLALFVTLMVLVSASYLHARHRHVAELAVEWCVVFVLIGFALVGIFSIGIFLMPAVLLAFTAAVAGTATHGQHH